MKEHGLLFSPSMIKATFEDRKSVTRRIIRVPKPFAVGDDISTELSTGSIKYPKWKKGDLIWCRERWRVWSWHEGNPIFIQYADGSTREVDQAESFDDEKWEERMWIQSGDDCEKGGMIVDEEKETYVWPDSTPEEERKNPCTRWRPSIHMPKIACRQWLRITKDVHYERIQDISEEDCQAEGLKLLQGGIRSEFTVLWDSLNKERGYGWDLNPYVRVINYERIKK